VRAFRVEQAGDEATVRAYRELRRRVFVDTQGLFDADDADERDADPRTVVLVARHEDGAVLGGVRLGPAGSGPDVGWWHGGRLVTEPGRAPAAVGPALVRAACACAERAGALRFEASIQARYERFFAGLGWQPLRPVTVAGAPHVLMRWPIGLLPVAREPAAELVGADLVTASDDAAPEVLAADPEWAGWGAVLAALNRVAARGADPVGLVDEIAAPDRSVAGRALAGLRRAGTACGVPVLAGHTRLGVPAALSVTALGRTAAPVPVAGRAGQRIRLTADLAGGWRPGYAGRQWDSTSGRGTAELRAMLAAVARGRPAAAREVGGAGICGTLGLLAEASGCGAVLDVAAVPRPGGASAGDWLTCAPGFAVLTADEPGRGPLPAGPADSVECGVLLPGAGVRLRWPDGVLTALAPSAGG
jgi:putative N-acetyltransferase (TIGR04045 family)